MIEDRFYEEKKELKDKKDNSFVKTFFDYAKIIILALLISFGIKTFVVTSTIVDGRSMNPTVNHGDRLIVNKLFFMKKNITRGDVIDFYVPESKKYYLKRVIAVEGDTVELINDRVYLNGKNWKKIMLVQKLLHHIVKLQNGKFQKDMFSFWGIIDQIVEIVEI